MCIYPSTYHGEEGERGLSGGEAVERASERVNVQRVYYDHCDDHLAVPKPGTQGGSRRGNVGPFPELAGLDFVTRASPSDRPRRLSFPPTPPPPPPPPQ